MPNEVPTVEVKPLTFREKRRQKLRKKLLNPVDIKYQGPLSYRYLRVLAWIAMIFAQIVVLGTIGDNIFNWNPAGQIGLTIFDFIGSLSTPFFIIASFGLVLSGTKSHKNFLMMYGAAFLGLGLALCLFYGRYIESLFNQIGVEHDSYEFVEAFLGSKAQINVFSDLFMFVLFHFFMNYNPKKIFVEKKTIIFRLFALLPLIYIITSYVLKILFVNKVIGLPFYFCPFMTTKSPLVFLLFASISLWIKNRERVFLKIGATKDDYKRYLKTKRNSLDFYITLSVFILIFFVIEAIVFIVLTIYYAVFLKIELAEYQRLTALYSIGQCTSMLLAIPFILLYSYTRTHKNKQLDLFIPVIGIALVVITYIEGIYQFLVHLSQM